MIEKLPGYFKDPHTLAFLPSSEGVLVALSGGADSSALLHLLCRLRQEKDFPLYAAHINHNIRTEKYGDEAARDQRFCTELCRKLGVELFVHSVDVPSMAAAESKSLETAARDARYAFFADVMRQRGIRILATAHNADDNFETQLFNLCRGCGIEGICGIPESRPVDGVVGGIAVRPILGATKVEILRLCEENGIEYVTDSTNFENDCVRNKLRLDIIPELKKIFGAPEKSGARLSSAAREDNDLITSMAESALSENEGRISLASLRAIHPAVAKRMLALSYGASSGGTLESTHINILFDFAAEGKNGSISLPGRINAVFENGFMYFEKSVPTAEGCEYLVLLSEGFNVIEGTDFAVLVSNDAAETANELDGYHLYHSAKINSRCGKLFAASRAEGDAIFSGGMHKRLKKLMCDHKIPKKDRDTLPIIKSDGEILLVPFCAVSDTARVKASDGYITLSVYKK